MAKRFRFRWWHGLIAGPLVGVLLWQADARLEWAGKPPMITRLTPDQFTQLVAAGAVRGAQPLMVELRVYPPVDGTNYVTGHALRSPWGKVTDREFEMSAPAPFVTPPLFGIGNGQQYPSVREYLAQVAPALPYRYVWWEEPRARAQLWIGGATLLIGVLVPLSVGGLVRAGLMRLPEEEPTEPERPTYADEKKPSAALNHAAVASQLQAATDSLEHKLRAHADPSTHPVVVATSELSAVTHGGGGGPADPAFVAPPEEHKSYDSGEFYPVSRGKQPGA